MYKVDFLYSNIAFRADLLAVEEVSNPLSSFEQCHDTAQTVLKIKGGSGYYEWYFTGSGIDGVYGTLMANQENYVTTSNQILTTREQQVVYIAPETSRVQRYGSIQVAAQDQYAVDASGYPLKQIFTINITPACISNLVFTDPAGTSRLEVSKGVPFAVKSIKAILSNGIEYIYNLPNQRIKLMVDPADAGYFEGQKYFYGVKNSGQANLYAVVDQIDPATESGSFAYTNPPLDIKFTEPLCQIQGQLVYGEGGGFGDRILLNQPVAVDNRMRTGENRVIYVAGGKDRYIYSSSNKKVVDIISLADLVQNNQNGETQADLTSIETEGEEAPFFLNQLNAKVDPVVTDYAVLYAIGSGAATIFIIDDTGCTAIQNIYVDNFPPRIEYAEFRGTASLVKGANDTLYLKLIELNSMEEDIIDIDARMVKGFYSDVDKIPDTAVKYTITDLSNPIVSKVESSTPDAESTAPVATSSYVRTYEIPISIPDYTEITNGYYTIIITVIDKRIDLVQGLNKVKKAVTLRIGPGKSGDISGEGKVDIADAVLALKIFTGQDNSGAEITLMDIIAILKQITQ
jgi:hypothetical protein